jgi:hypothetical protein
MEIYFRQSRYAVPTEAQALLSHCRLAVRAVTLTDNSEFYDVGTESGYPRRP